MRAVRDRGVVGGGLIAKLLEIDTRQRSIVTGIMRAMETATVAWLAIVVFVAFTTEATAGFGASIISLTLGSLFLPIETLLPIVVPLDVALALYIVLRHREHIAWRFLLVRVLPLMLTGAAAGYAVSSQLGGPVMKQIFGTLVVALSALELWRLARAGRNDTRPLPTPIDLLVILAAGVVHGIYATGGPLLVYSIGRSNLAKSELRSTLAAVWLILNTVLSTTYMVSGRITGDKIESIGLMAPVLVVAIVAGEALHSRIPDRPFRALVFTLLLGAGILVLV